jgi:hypothetical protein
MVKARALLVTPFASVTVTLYGGFPEPSLARVAVTSIEVEFTGTAVIPVGVLIVTPSRFDPYSVIICVPARLGVSVIPVSTGPVDVGDGVGADKRIAPGADGVSVRAMAKARTRPIIGGCIIEPTSASGRNCRLDRPSLCPASALTAKTIGLKVMLIHLSDKLMTQSYR